MAEEMDSIGIIKQANLFTFTADIVDTVTEEPVPGVADKLRCQGRYPNKALAGDSVITETAVPGTYLFNFGIIDWNVGTVFFDIKYDDIKSSDDFFVLVVRGQTE